MILRTDGGYTDKNGSFYKRLRRGKMLEEGYEENSLIHKHSFVLQTS